MQTSTSPSRRHTSPEEGVVRDGRIGRYGLIFLDDLDTEEFRSLRGRAPLLVYMVLSTFAQKGTGESFPMQSTIASITGLTRETVNRAIGQLEKAGLVERSARMRNNREIVVYTLQRAPSRRV